MNKIYLALVHHPILNKSGETVTTSVTNLDIHDISRSCRTFGVLKYFIVTPMKAQKELVERITGHWKTNKASEYNPDRADALGVAKVVNNINDAVQEITKLEGVRPLTVVTSAKNQGRKIEVIDLISKLGPDKAPLFILFGTGHGLTNEVVEDADFCLTPIVGSSTDGYNHLSVRSAVAIYLDRLRVTENNLK